MRSGNEPLGAVLPAQVLGLVVMSYCIYPLGHLRARVVVLGGLVWSGNEPQGGDTPVKPRAQALG